MPLLRRKSVFVAKTETTIGTAELLTSAEGVYNAMNVDIQPNITVDEREGQGGFNYLAGIPGLRSGTAKFTTELSFVSEAIPTWASVLLPACGWVDDSGTFSPITSGPGSNGVKTLTIGNYIDGKLRKLSGCMGTFVINLPTGKMATIDWTFTGKWYEPTDAAMVTPTYPTALPRRFAEGSIAYDSSSMCVSNATIDAGNEVIVRECAGDVTGMVSAMVTNRKPTISADPESVLVATQNRNNDFLTSATNSLVTTIGDAGDGQIVISAPAAQIVNDQQGERNGLLIDTLNWDCTKGSSADTELTIEFVDAV